MMKLCQPFARTTRKINLFHVSALSIIVIFLLLSVSKNAMALTKPTLKSPGNNAQVTTPSVTFSWSHPFNDSYELKIKTDGGTLKYASGKTSSKSKTVNFSSIPLTAGSTYKWYVVVYANGQEISSSDSWFTYKPAVPAPAVQPKPVVSSRVDLSGGLYLPTSVAVGENFSVSFNLKEFQGGTKTFESLQLWIQNSAGGDLYSAQQWSNVSFAANQQRTFSATTSLNPAQGRSAGTYRAIVRGKVAGETPFNFGVVSGSGAANPKTFTAVAAASPPPPSPSQPQPVKPAVPATAVQPKPVVSSRVDLSGGLYLPSSVAVGENFSVSFNLKEFQGGTKTFESLQLWIQNSAGGDLYSAQQWSNVSFAANQQRTFSATTSLNPAQGRSAGTYRAIVRGKVAGETPFNFGVLSGSGAANPKTFTVVASATPPPPSPSQPQPAVPAPAVQPKPVVSSRVDLSGGLYLPTSVDVGENFSVSFNLKEFQGGTKTFEYLQLWIQNSAGGDLYTAKQWSNVAFAANQQRTFSATTSLNPAQGRSAGTYRAIVRGKVAGEAPSNFGVLSGSGAANPKTFTVVASATPSSPSPSQPQPAVPAPAAQPKPVVSGRVDLSRGLNVSPSPVTIGKNFTVSFNLKEYQGGAKTFEYVQLWIQNSGGDDLYTAKQWSNVAFATNAQKSFSATTNLDPAQGRSAGPYRVIVRGKVAGEEPFNFGMVGGGGGGTPKTFTAVAAAQPPPVKSSEQSTQSGSVKIGNGPYGGNCVLYLRNKPIQLPEVNLTYFDQKQQIATKNEPRKGSVAIIRILKGVNAKYGHVALVTGVIDDGNKKIISLEEANYPSPGYWVRSISGENIKDIEKKANIIGYYYP